MTVLQRPEPPVASLDIRLDPLYYWGMNSVKHSANPPRKTKPKGRHPDKALSAAFVRTAPPGRHCDGNGLYLYVQPTGTRSWIQRLAIRGRNRELGLGSVALISLAEAPRAGAGQPQARALGRRPARRETPHAGRAELRGIRREGDGTEADRLAQSGS